MPVGRRVAVAAHRIDSDPRLLAAIEWARARLPGDAAFGDPLSTGGDPVGRLAAQLSSLAVTRPSVLREVGLSALQVFQAHAGVDDVTGEQEVAVLFTDLADFSEWTLRVGDEVAVAALRRIGTVVEPVVARRGRVVKRLGDGLMAVFADVDDAVGAAVAARDAVEELDLDGHRPHLRAGVHLGRPQRLGGDYYGRDVNVAARITDAAGAGEVCVSSTARDRLGDRTCLHRVPYGPAKGVPAGISSWRVEAPAPGAGGSPAGPRRGRAAPGSRR